jgi:hypothetical protein
MDLFFQALDLPLQTNSYNIHTHWKDKQKQQWKTKIVAQKKPKHLWHLEMTTFLVLNPSLLPQLFQTLNPILSYPMSNSACIEKNAKNTRWNLEMHRWGVDSNILIVLNIILKNSQLN